MVKTFKEEAKSFLSGNRVRSVVFLLFCVALIQLVNYVISRFALKAEIYDMVLTCIYVFLGYPFLCVITKYFYTISKGKKKKTVEILSPFDRSYMTIIYFSFLLYTVLYVLHFVPAVKWLIYIFLYIYGFAGSFVIAQNTDINFKDFLMMSNSFVFKNAFKMIKLTLSFVGWFTLGIITFGVGFLWVIPYFFVAMGRLYENSVSLKKKRTIK